MAGQLDGKVVLITGASSGIGEATGRLVAEQGALPVLTARRIDRLEAIAKELDGALAIQADVRDPEQVHHLVQTTMERYGRVDVLVNNAGQGLHLPLEQISLEDLVAITELNFYAPLVAMQAVVPIMRDRGGGVIVNVSSGTSRMVLPGVGAYAATKAALNMLSLVAREEFAPDGIVVSLVYPRVTATEFHDKLRAGAIRAGGGGLTPHSPRYVAKAILQAILTGEAEIVIPHGPERSEDMEVPGSQTCERNLPMTISEVPIRARQGEASPRRKQHSIFTAWSLLDPNLTLTRTQHQSFGFHRCSDASPATVSTPSSIRTP